MGKAQRPTQKALALLAKVDKEDGLACGHGESDGPPPDIAIQQSDRQADLAQALALCGGQERLQVANHPP
jgi:hypothetical protein